MNQINAPTVYNVISIHRFDLIRFLLLFVNNEKKNKSHRRYQNQLVQHLFLSLVFSPSTEDKKKQPCN